MAAQRRGLRGAGRAAGGLARLPPPPNRCTRPPPGQERGSLRPRAARGAAQQNGLPAQPKAVCAKADLTVFADRRRALWLAIYGQPGRQPAVGRDSSSQPASERPQANAQLVRASGRCALSQYQRVDGESDARRAATLIGRRPALRTRRAIYGAILPVGDPTTRNAWLLPRRSSDRGPDGVILACFGRN